MALTPGLSYFKQQMLERLDFRPEHKTTAQRQGYVREVITALRQFDDVVLLEVSDSNWKGKFMPPVQTWVNVCRRFQSWVDTVNRDLETMMDINTDPDYEDPDLTQPRDTFWWP